MKARPEPSERPKSCESTYAPKQADKTPRRRWLRSPLLYSAALWANHPPIRPISTQDTKAIVSQS